MGTKIITEAVSSLTYFIKKTKQKNTLVAWVSVKQSQALGSRRCNLVDWLIVKAIVLRMTPYL